MGKLGTKQLETLQVIGPSRFMMITTKADQKHADRLVDLGLAKYPKPSKASRKKTMGDGGFLVITAKGVAALEEAGLWPHPYAERPNP